MKKRALALILGMVMLLGILAGCGEQNKPGGQSIKVWIPPYAKSDAELTDQMFWDQQFDAFEKEHNCTVEVEILPWDGYKQKVTTGLISNEGPDVVYIDTPYDLVETGAFEPLDSYFTAEEADQYLYWDLGQIMGKQYIAPMLVGNASVLYCNMDILKQAGFDRPPETWDELIDYCLAIQEKVPDVSPFLQNWGGSGKGVLMVSWLPYYWQTGESFLDAEGKPSINNAGGLKTVEFLKSLMDKGRLKIGLPPPRIPRTCSRRASWPCTWATPAVPRRTPPPASTGPSSPPCPAPPASRRPGSRRTLWPSPPTAKTRSRRSTLRMRA